MLYGIEAHLREIARFRRRVGSLMSGVSLGSLLVFAVAGRQIAARFDEDVKRFGFEGPEQWVDRIRLELIAPNESTGLYDLTYVTPESRKGHEKKRRSRDSLTPDDVRPHDIGEGLDDLDLVAKARMLRLDAPVIRSEDLIIERLVRPAYPEEARTKNIEGVVEMLALVDTTGDVVEVHIVGGTRDALLETAATQAVLQCHYRPYRVHEMASRVWAAFRIAFTLY